MHSKMYQRILAIFLIITLTFANPLLITKSFAASIFDDSGDTGSKNVEFTASFKADDDDSHTAICDVNSQDLAINLKVNVKDKGYVKNAKVAIVPEDGELNFALKGTTQEVEKELEQTAAEVTRMNAEAFVSSGAFDDEELILPEEATTTVVTGVTENDSDLIEEEIGTGAVVTQDQVPSIDLIDDSLGGNSEVITQVPSDEVTTPTTQDTTPTVEPQVDVPQVEVPVVDETPITILNDMVESVEDNVVSLKQIASKSQVLVSLPFKYVQEEYINPNKVNKDSKVVFSGIYVDEKGHETELYKEVKMNVSWTYNNSISLSSEITKYIPFTNGDKTGVILQTVVRVSNTTLANTLPVNGTKLTVDVPSLQGVKPNSMNLVANKTELTNGKSADSVVFTDANWSYDELNNQITITSKNELQEVVINRNNGSFVDETIEEIRENRLYSLSGVDEYTLTYVYENIQMQNVLELNSNVAGEVESYGVTENGVMLKAYTSENFKYNLTGPVGEIVSYNVENITDGYSKAYVYLNNNNSDNYEIKVDSREIINVSLKDIVKDMTITDTNAFYTTREDRVATNDFTYNYIEISKDNFDQILGENGSLTIKDLSGNVVATINNESEVNDNGIININLSNLKLNRIQITTSAPINDGDLIINVERSMTKSSLNKAEYAGVEAVTFETSLTSNYNYVGTQV